MEDVLISRGLPHDYVDSLFDTELSALYKETDGRSLSIHALSTSPSNIPEGILDFSSHFVVSSYDSGENAGYIE